MQKGERHADFTDVETFVEEVDASGSTKVRTDEWTEVKEKPTVRPEKNRQEGEKPLRAKDFLDGSILIRDTMTRQIPFVLFLTVLAILYIGNRYHAESMVRKIAEAETEVKNLRSEQITTAAELMNISRPSEVAAIVTEKNLGLKQSVDPPKKLIRKRGL